MTLNGPKFTLGGGAVSTRRRFVALALAGTGVLARRAQAENAQIGGLMFTQIPIPPAVEQLGKRFTDAEVLTEPVLQSSSIPQVKAFRDFLDDLRRRNLSRDKQISAVQTWVDAHVKGVNDYDLYQITDVWAPPINTLVVGGDCEDIALLKAWGLVRLGFAFKDLFLVIGLSILTNPPSPHAVLAVRLANGEYRRLDNLERQVMTGGDFSDFMPAYGVNPFGFWKIDLPGVDGDYRRHAFERANAARAAKR